MFILPTQPMMLNEAVKNTFKLWWTTLTLVLPLSIAMAVLSSWSIFLGHWVQIETHKTLFITITVIVELINLVPMGALYAKIGHTIYQQPITLSQSLAVGIIRFFPALIFLMIAMVFIGSIGFLSAAMLTKSAAGFTLIGMLLGIALMILAVYALCAFPLIILEKQTAFQAIRKSIMLVKGHWWYSAGLIFSMVAFGMLVNMLLKMLMGSFGLFITSCVISPLYASAIIILYEDLKRRAAVGAST